MVRSLPSTCKGLGSIPTTKKTNSHSVCIELKPTRPGLSEQEGSSGRSEDRTFPSGWQARVAHLSESGSCWQVGYLVMLVSHEPDVLCRTLTLERTVWGRGMHSVYWSALLAVASRLCSPCIMPVSEQTIRPGSGVEVYMCSASLNGSLFGCPS